jgi:hypothetical protein
VPYTKHPLSHVNVLVNVNVTEKAGGPSFIQSRDTNLAHGYVYVHVQVHVHVRTRVSRNSFYVVGYCAGLSAI